MTILTPTGRRRVIIPGWHWYDQDAGRGFTGTETAEYLASQGYTIVPDPEPVVPTLAALRAAALARYRMEAESALRVAAPWDVLISVATFEYRLWIEDLQDVVAAELARLEEAVAAAPDAEALAAIVADWPEVIE